jgi:hypothetical protein
LRYKKKEYAPSKRLVNPKTTANAVEVGLLIETELDPEAIFLVADDKLGRMLLM